MSWSPPAGALDKEAALLLANQELRGYIGERVLRISTDIDLQILRQEVDRIRVQMPQDMEVLSVNGENIREWHTGPNVVDEAPEATEAWRGPIAGFPDLDGWLDLLTLELPAEACDDVLTGLEFEDTSQLTLGEADPALNIAGVSVALCP